MKGCQNKRNVTKTKYQINKRGGSEKSGKIGKKINVLEYPNMKKKELNTQHRCKCFTTSTSTTI